MRSEAHQSPVSTLAQSRCRFPSDLVQIQNHKLENTLNICDNSLIVLCIYTILLHYKLVNHKHQLGESHMVKSALAVLFSLLYVLFIAPPALAKDTSATTTSSRKSIAKKTAVSKRKIKIAAGTKRHSAANDGAEFSSYLSGKPVKKIIAVRVKRKVMSTRVAHVVVIRRAPLVLSAGEQAGLNRTDDPLDLKSNAALVVDPSNSEVLFAKNADAVLPIASITKLMTALVVVESRQDMTEVLTVTEEDIDRLKNTSSRLRVGSQLTRANMLHIALMSSENRAASALGRHYPGGMSAFVAAMNAKAQALGMTDTRYVEPTGLSSQNVSSPRDLVKLVTVAQQHPIIREYSTNSDYAVDPGGSVLQYRNSNRLVANPTWEIGLQKTGYISEAGRCLVMQAMIEGREIVMVFLDAKGKFSRSTDAGRIRTWLETVKMPAMSRTTSLVQADGK